MLFELRTSCPEVSPQWQEARDLFLNGQVRQAWSQVDSQQTSATLETAEDYLLHVEIARACAIHARYMALVRLAAQRFPQNPLVQLYHARVLLTRSRQAEAIEFLQGLEATTGQSHRAWWGTELANVYASAGFGTSCEKWLQEVEQAPQIDSPLALYTRSCASEGLRQWDTAIELAERCVNSAPDWSRARAYLINCLLSRGRMDDAQVHLQEAANRGHQEALIDITDAMLQMSLGNFEQARDGLEQFVAHWPQADFIKWVKRTLCILLVELGDYDGARRVADGQEERFALPTIPEQAEGAHCFLSLPLIAQDKNQCVPTSVAMAVHPQGHSLRPEQLFQEMKGREGAVLWRMRECCESHGFDVIPIRLEQEAVVALLDAGIPVIGVLEGPFNSHVEVVCGYSNDLQTIYVRDPAHWAPVAWPWDLAWQRYETHCGVLAVIDRTRTDALQTAEAWRSVECQALMDLSQAVAQGEREAAEAAYELIPDDSPGAVLRDGFAVEVVISPSQFGEKMQATAERDDATPLARFRAALTLGDEDSEEILKQLLEGDEEQQFGAMIRRYLTLMRHMRHGEWPQALELTDRLLVRGSGISQFWELRSDVLAELGEHAASQAALDNAIELEPLRVSAREKALRRAASQLTLEEYLQEFEALLKEDPDDKRLLHSRASVMQDGPDGLAFEAAARDVLRWFPRSPTAYLRLLQWYSHQDRSDLEDALLSEAQQLLPQIFGSDDEASEPQPTDETPQQAEAESAEPSTESLPLPETRDELLELIWQTDDPRRAAALQRAVTLDAEGTLHWYESARLLACRLLIPDDPEQAKIDAVELLPKQVPGAREWYVDVLLDVLTSAKPDLHVARAVDEWLPTVIPSIEDFPDLWFQRVVLLEQAREMEQALAELQRLLERYPATSSALYRMGVVKFGQQDYPAAQDYFRRALEVNPGLYGAMSIWRDVCDTVGDAEQSLRCTRLLRRKLPHQIGYLEDELLAVANQVSPAAAEESLNAMAADLPKRNVTLLRIRLLLAAGRVEEAARYASEVTVSAEDNDQTFESGLQALMRIALAQENSLEVQQLCRQGLERWPDSARLKEILAGELSVSAPQEAESLLRETLCAGDGSDETAWQYLLMTQQPADLAARAVVQAAAEPLQEGLAELFAQVMDNPRLLPWYESHLKWAHQQFPDALMFPYLLAMYCNINNQSARAVRLAEQYYERHPDRPEAARLLGCCLVDVDPRRALKFLEEVCEKNRSADRLFDLARCCQVVGEQKRSQDLHWEILGQNPFLAASWTNLYLAGGSRERLWSFVNPILDHGYGVEDEYFAVAAVQLAVELRRSLSPAWLPVAARRWAVLQTHPGFQDERPRLKDALLTWRAVRPDDVQNGMQLPDRWLNSVWTRFGWPGRGWIPSAGDRVS